MTASITAKKHHKIPRARPAAAVMAAAGLALGLAACSTTRQTDKGVEESGFLGDYSQLKQGTKGNADRIYIDPSADWKKYTKIKIDHVQLWHSDQPDSELGKLSKEDKQMLIDFLHTALVEHLAKDLPLTEQAGPDVLVVKSAITEAQKSHPAIDLISSVYPAAIALSYGKQLIWGTGTGVGAAQIELEILDGQSNQRLLALVDRRAGTKALRTKFEGWWGDIKLSFDWWSQKLQTFLAQERAGTAEKINL